MELRYLEVLPSPDGKLTRIIMPSEEVGKLNRIVNAHDDLVTMLCAARDELACHEGPRVRYILNQISAALAKAEG